jgi:hypothetical protein
VQEARVEFGSAVRRSRDSPATAARALVWVGILGLPAGVRERSSRLLVALSRALDAARRTTRPVAS